MKIKILSLFAGILFAGILFAHSAFASDCTKHGSVTTTSVQVETANDIGPSGLGVTGRHYMLIQNTGQTNGMNVALGSSNAATAQDMYLGPNSSWVLSMAGGAMVPGGDVAVISTSTGTSWAFCDY